MKLRFLVAAVLAMVVCTAPGVMCTVPVEVSRVGTYDGFMAKRFEEVCGPLPVYKDLITSFDVQGFVRSVLGDKMTATHTWADPWGIQYQYSLPDPQLSGHASASQPADFAGAKKLPPYISVHMGIFASQQEALQALAFFCGHSSVGGGGIIKGYGDRSKRYQPSDLLLTLNNALVDLHVDRGDEEILESFAQALINELKNGNKFATHGSTVPTPNITLLGLPERFSLRKPVKVNVSVEHADFSTLLVGYDNWVPVRFAKVGSDMEITVERATGVAGHSLKATIFLATPSNVMGSKEIKLDLD